MKKMNDIFIPFLQALPISFRGKKRLARLLLKKTNEECEIPTRYGRMTVPNLIEPIAWDLAIDGCYEPDLCRFIKAKISPGDVCLDIGANIGAISRIMAEKVSPTGKVYSFEPSPKIFEYLIRNTRDLEQNSCHELAVSALSGEKVFYQAPENKFGMGTLSALPGWRATKVAVTSLDEFWQQINTPKISFIKVDVEGHELEVFQGGRQALLKNEQILVVFEYSDWAERNAYGKIGESPRFLAGLGFQLGNLEKNGRVRPLKDDLPKAGSWNLVACQNLEQRLNRP